MRSHFMACFLSADFFCNLYLLSPDFFHTKHSPVEHHLNDLFPPRVLCRVFQTNPFFLFIVMEVRVFLLLCVTLVRPARRFLLDFKPGVDIICEEPQPSVLFAEMPHLMNFNDTITELRRFLQFFCSPRPSQHPFLICMRTQVGSFQPVLLLFFANTGGAEGEGEFTTTPDGEYRME